MTHANSSMAREIRETPGVIARQAAVQREPLSELAVRLRRRPPEVVVTCARGTSAHAATFGKHLVEHKFGIPVAPAAPSITTVYRRPLRLRNQLFLAVSQSGRSDDLIEQSAAARSCGALTAALVNVIDSPLAKACEFVLPIAAGPENSVAATKTFVGSLAALARLVAIWSQDRDLSAAIDRLPERLARAAELEWHAPIDALSAATSLICVGRGPTLAIAREAALKLKETCNLHAEAFSGAELLHGPITLVTPDYPILIFMPTDEAATGMRALSDSLRNKGAAVFVAEYGSTGADGLPVVTPDHPVTDAVCLVQSFYAMAIALADERGLDVDQPRHLQKVTRTR